MLLIQLAEVETDDKALLELGEKTADAIFTVFAEQGITPTADVVSAAIIGIQIFRTLEANERDNVRTQAGVLAALFPPLDPEAPTLPAAVTYCGLSLVARRILNGDL